MSMNLNPDEVKEKSWILWRWKGSKAFGKSYLQKVVPVENTAMLELTDYDWPTRNPLRILLNEIEVIIPSPNEQLS